MAYTKEQWSRAKFLFELGHSLREIESDCKISSGQIGKRSRSEEWKKDTTKQSIKSDIMALDKKKDTLDKEKDTLLPRIASLSDFEVTILDEITTVDGIKGFVLSTTTLSMIRKNQLLTKNTKQTIEYKTTYSDDGKPLMKTPVVFDVELTPNDIKSIDEGIDKNIISLELAPRHAPKSDVNLVNAQQNQPTQITIVRDE